MPSCAGVYRMLDANDNALYVGKAKNLAKRVVNYTKPERLEYRLQSMIANTAKMEIITTKTEAEALLLEANLIKKLKPRYNILLRDDKTYPHIFLSGDHDYPRITKHRGAQKIKGNYYGPFASAGAVNTTITDLQKAFLIRSCSDNEFSGRTRACIEYQIKRCSAPCVDKISQENYSELISQAKNFLKGKSRDIQENLVKQMEIASAELNYEKASMFRDRIKALNKIQAKQNINVPSIKNADIIGIYSNSGQSCIQVFFFRGGQNYGNRAFFPKHEEASDEDILVAFIGQFYQKNIPPNELIISTDIAEKNLLQEALESLVSYKIRITRPKTGDKKKIIDDAVKNAQNALQHKILSSVKQKNLLEGIATIFELEHTPKRIEVYDNSHIMGTHQLGAMIVADSDGFNKKAYRRFDIKNKNTKPGDDYAMMTEVLTRRLKRLKQECPDKKSGIWPDLLLIDGGKGHMGIVKQVLKNLDLEGEIIFACISKGPDRNAGREQFHMPGKKSFTLPHNDPVMYYLQILRDEAHRFAIGGHRNKRSKAITKSVLDDIPGIGARRKKILLNHFGSADDIKNASLEELIKADGINKKTAEDIYNFFN